MTTSDHAVPRLVADIDRRLPTAYARLTFAREALARYPSATRRRECEIAEAEIDALLDRRLALVPARMAPLGGGAARLPV